MNPVLAPHDVYTFHSTLMAGSSRTPLFPFPEFPICESGTERASEETRVAPLLPIAIALFPEDSSLTVLHRVGILGGDGNHRKSTLKNQHSCSKFSVRQN